MNKKCLVIYIGIGYTPTFVKNASGNSYFYATDTIRCINPIYTFNKKNYA